MNIETNEVLINKYCNELCSEDKKQRKRSIENIKNELLGLSNASSEKLITLYELVHKHLINCFKDKTESIREIAVVTVTEVIQVIPVKQLYFESLMPVISDRLSGDVVLENSEEVRLCLVKLLSLLVSKYKNCLFQYLNDFINILAKTISDPYPKVKLESCECAAELAKSIPQHFHMQSESLITPLINTLLHQHYRIRVAGIRSIGAVIRYGNNKSVNDVCGPLAERLFDQHHAVRAAVASVVGMWLLELPDRYSYFHKLIPLMLTSLTDEIPEHRKEAEEIWAKVGEQFTMENETDLKDKIDYLQETLEHYPANTRRPNLGCRNLVQRELSKYLPAIATELDDWKDDVRVKSAQLMCVTVQHAESTITQHLERTLPALYRACGDADTRVQDNIELAADMIGYFVPPDVYCRLVLPTIQEMPSAGPLRVMAAVLRSSQRREVQPQLPQLASLLASEDVCYSRQVEYQKQLLSVVRSLVSVSQQDLLPVTQDLFTVIMSVLGMAADPTITRQAQGLLEDLSKCNDTTASELYIRHTPELLDKVTTSVEEWSLHTPQRFVFEALLTNSGQAVGQNIAKVLAVLELGVRPEVEPEAVLQTLMAVSFVLTHSEQTLADVNDLPQVINTLCSRVLKPQLVWRAGRSAEALRTAAVGCVVAALNLHACPHSLAESLVPLLLSLLEDPAFKTRQFATLSLLNIVKSLRAESSLNAEDISQIFVVVMKRLDDNNDKVRETAVRTLCELFRSPLPSDYSTDGYRTHLEALFDTMLLHLDDPVPAFQEIMFGALKEISTSQPQLLRSRIKVDNFRSKIKCEQLVKFLEETHL